MKVTMNFDKLGAAFSDMVKDQTPYAMSRLLNDSLFYTHRQNKAYMASGVRGSIKGGPERHTNNAFKIKKSSKYNLRGAVYVQGGREYLDLILEGGTRVAKNKKLPSPAKGQYGKILNKRGNFPRNWLQDAMTEAMTARGAQWTRLGQGRRKNRNFKGSPNNYFIQKFRTGSSVLKQRKGGEAIALVWFTDKVREQRKTFYARERARTNFNEFVNKHVDDYLLTVPFNEVMYRLDIPVRLKLR